LIIIKMKKIRSAKEYQDLLKEASKILVMTYSVKEGDNKEL